MNVGPSWMADVLASPRADEPRLRAADVIEPSDPVRAAFIRADLQWMRAEVDALTRYEYPAVAAEVTGPLYRRADRSLRAHRDEWARREQVPAGTWIRGFLESHAIDETTAVDATVATFARFPILHLSATRAALLLRDRALDRCVAQVATLSLDVAKGEVPTMLERFDLRPLRRLDLGGEVTLDDLHAICQADLPGLEELQVFSKLVATPCDEPFSMHTYGIPLTDAYASEVGLELEARYGWKKYFHAAARFTLYPSPVGVLDTLPPHPPEPYVLRRMHRGGRIIEPWPVPGSPRMF